MANYNKVILMGNLTRDPQMSYLPSKTPVVEFGMAINRKWRGQDGQQRDETCFVDCRAYGRQAEVFNQYMRKGRPVMVDGRLQFSSWESQDGQKRSKLRVVVENFQFLGTGAGPGGGGGPEGAAYPSQGRPQQRNDRDMAPGGAQEPPPPDYDDAGGDNIPF
jgi:single-strand DNA-binding protein